MAQNTVVRIDVRRNRSPAQQAARALFCAISDAARREATPTAESASAARGLYRAMLGLYYASDNPAGECHRVAGPLYDLVVRHNTRRGQELCNRLGRALARGDHITAFEACRELIEIERFAAR